MRTIETKMNSAIQNSKDWRQSNTRVENYDNVSHVYLHGNLIAKVGETWLELYDGGWRTKTTKSRLNAILHRHGNGERVYQRAHRWYIATGCNEQPFVSGIRLN